MSKYVSTDNIETIVDLLLQNDKEIKTNADTQVTSLSNSLNNKADKTEITALSNALDTKADISSIETTVRNEVTSYITENPINSSYPVLSAEGSTVVNDGYPYGDVRRYGAVVDGITDDRTAIVNALSCNDVVMIPNGTCFISQPIALEQGKTIRGNGRDVSKILIDSSVKVLTITAYNNIKDLQLESTYGTVSGYGLITGANAGAYTNIIRCGFKSASGNGIKIIAESAIVSNMLIQDCYFHDMGRMGIEFQNHVIGDGMRYDGYNTIMIRNCDFNGTGMKEYGMGISLSGYGTGIIVDNCSFDNMGECAIELVGCCNSIFSNLTFKQSGSAYRALQCTNARVMTDNIFNNLTCIEPSKGGLRCFIRNSKRLLFTNCKLGQLELKDLTDSKFNNLTIVSANNYAIILEGECKRNSFDEVTVDDLTYIASHYSTIRFNGANCINNVFKHFSITKKTSGSYIDAINSGDITANTFYDIKCEDNTVIRNDGEYVLADDSVYKSLLARVVALETKLQQTMTFTKLTLTKVIGSYGVTTDGKMSKQTDNVRIRTENAIEIGEGKTIRLVDTASDFLYGCYGVDSTGTTKVSWTAYTSDSQILPAGYYLFVFKKTDGSDMTESDLTNAGLEVSE